MPWIIGGSMLASGAMGMGSAALSGGGKGGTTQVVWPRQYQTLPKREVRQLRELQTQVLPSIKPWNVGFGGQTISGWPLNLMNAYYNNLVSPLRRTLAGPQAIQQPYIPSGMERMAPYLAMQAPYWAQVIQNWPSGGQQFNLAQMSPAFQQWYGSALQRYGQ